MRYLVVLCAAMACAAADGDSGRDDLVLLDNRQRLTGLLEDDPKSAEHVLIRGPAGTMRLRKSKIAGVELGLTSRLARVRGDDLAGLLALATWCRERGYHQEALDLLDKARRLPGFDRESAGLYARLVDELRGPEEAVPLYAWYRSQGGTDPAILERIRELVAAGADLDGAGTAPAAATHAVTAAPAAPEVERPASGQGLELRGWTAENPQYSNKAEVSTVNGGIKVGLPGVRKALKVELPPGGDKDKAAIKLGVNYSVAPDSAILRFTCVNQGELPLKFAIAVKTGEWVFHESVPQQVGAGAKAELRFDLREATFKTQASGWAHTAKVDGLDDVKEVQLMIFNRDRPATVLVSGMRFTGDQEL
jgi:hypothetical protein